MIPSPSGSKSGRTSSQPAISRSTVSLWLTPIHATRTPVGAQYPTPPLPAPYRQPPDGEQQMPRPQLHILADRADGPHYQSPSQTQASALRRDALRPVRIESVARDWLEWHRGYDDPDSP